jgi:hypothetical protein
MEVGVRHTIVVKFGPSVFLALILFLVAVSEIAARR